MKTIPSINIFVRIKNKIKRSCISYKKHIQYFLSSKKISLSQSNQNQSIPLITIFGSCRQDSIYKLYPVTSIKNDLSYTHYTKEIIQAIEYCKGIRRELDETVFFRSSLLKNRLINKSFTKEFNNTDVFIIEIASRIAYKYKNRFIHHEAYDNPIYRELLSEDVIVKELTDEEIECDLLEIRNLLHPKKFIVITHIDTKKTGARSSLVNLLKKICPKMGIPVIDPSILLEHHSEDLLFKKNDSARHYTDYGHSKIKFLYQEAINEIMSYQQKELIQVYSSKPQKDNPGSYHGFGDFLMGALTVNQVAKKLGSTSKVSFNDHHINKFFYNRSYLDSNELNEIKYVFSDSAEVIDFVNHKYVFTNKRPKFTSQEDKNFVLMNCLQPRISFNTQFKILTKELRLPSDFITLHIRGMDNDENVTKNFLMKITALLDKIIMPEKKYLLLSNSNIIIEHINRENFIKTNLGRCHTGIQDFELNNLKDTLLEFMLMSKSKQIIQLSTYQWGSNFSNIISELYDIPIKKYKIEI